MLTLLTTVTSGRHCQPESGVPAKDVVAINLGVIRFDLARSVSEPKLIADHFQRPIHGGALCRMTTTEKSPDGNGTGHGERSPDQCRPIDVHASGDDSNFPAGGRDIHPSLDCGEAESAIGIARRICQLGSHNIDEQTTSAIPGYQASTSTSTTNSATGQRIPISSILSRLFPPMELVYSLLEDYFDAVHWFSLAVYEPKFRKSLLSIADGYAYPSQRPFLVLLAMMLAMSSWYRSQKSCTDPADSSDYMEKLSADWLGLVESNVVELMDQPSVTSAQTCILLGSHHVYHGRPNLSFSLLGATIKMSQSLGMHRGLVRGDFETIEERKRVWWTIYTWDRFASITYGRPLGINDKDCNLDMPADVFENPKFVASASSQASPICYSTYQRELNKLYLIASPALKTVFGSRTLRTSEQLNGDTYLALVRHATENLQKWRSCLPSHLALDLNRDFNPDDRPNLRAHALQSLSLQLTYDNVLIVLHRPLLARQVDHLYTVNTQSPEGNRTDNIMYHPNTAPSLAQSNLSSDSTFPNTQTTSPDLWMNAATRTSRVTEMPALAQLATDSHLGAFLAINLFNAAIVLAVMALSEPLSDTAQEVKRTITRILRLQDLLGRRFALSKQSTAVLKNVVIMLLRRESAAMLAPITGTSQVIGHQPLQALADPSLISVEDTLRMPLDVAWDSRNPLARDQRLPDLSRADRLNNSLTSVQYALGLGDRSGIHTGGVWQPAEYDWSMSGLSREPVENNHQDNVEGGLYWLWDMTWNGV
ncbi:Transcription factor [Penicillium cf. griseofulvum]|nr:Transcription factor [Penicillium cf. griseofulvum]